MREKAKGYIVLTRGALYVFSNNALSKPKLRIHVNPLQCISILQTKTKVVLTLPPLKKVDNTKSNGKNTKANEFVRLDKITEDDINDYKPRLPIMDNSKVVNIEEMILAQEQQQNQQNDNGFDEDIEAAKKQESPNKVNIKKKKDVEDFTTSSDDENESEPEIELPQQENEADEQEIEADAEAKEEEKENFIVYLFHTSPFLLLRYFILILESCFQSVPYVVKPVIESKIKSLKKIILNPKHSLKKRAIFLAHYSFTDGNNLESAEYFQQKWDGKDPLLIIGKNFHPGDYAAPFACAVAWETKLKSVCFQGSHFGYIGPFITLMLKHALTIKTVGFTDYPRGSKIYFSFKDVGNTTIDTWSFLNCCGDVVSDFVKAAIDLTTPIKELTIGRHAFNLSDATNIFNAIADTPTINQVPTMTLVNLNFNDFPYDSFCRLSQSLTQLTTIHIQRLNIDGSILFSAVCSGCPKIRYLSLSCMKFEETRRNKRTRISSIPQNLVVISIAKSKFIAGGLYTFLQNVNKFELPRPIFFVARNVQIEEKCWTLMKEEMDLTSLKPNMLEFDFSESTFPNLAFQPFFKFLETQSRLRMLVLNSISTDDQRNFIHKLASIMSRNKFAGVDVSGHFDPYSVQQFLASLANCSSLRRLSIKNCGAGNKAMFSLMNLLNLVKDLNELVADGFKAQVVPKEQRKDNERHPLIMLWQQIASKKNILANDIPVEDLALIGHMDPYPLLKEEDRVMLKNLKPPNRRIPSTMRERLDFTLQSLDEGDQEKIELAYSPEIFMLINNKRPRRSTVDLHARNVQKDQTEEPKDDFDDDDDDNFSEPEGNMNSDELFSDVGDAANTDDDVFEDAFDSSKLPPKKNTEQKMTGIPAFIPAIPEAPAPYNLPPPSSQISDDNPFASVVSVSSIGSQGFPVLVQPVSNQSSGHPSKNKTPIKKKEEEAPLLPKRTGYGEEQPKKPRSRTGREASDDEMDNKKRNDGKHERRHREENRKPKEEENHRRRHKEEDHPYNKIRDDKNSHRKRH